MRTDGLYYKVIALHDGRPMSSWSAGNARVYYSTKGPVCAPTYLAVAGYHLSVFKSLQHAIDYTTRLSIGDEIWLAQITGRQTKLPPMMSSAYMTSLEIAVRSYGEKWPPGTVMVETVRLVKRIWRRGDRL